MTITPALASSAIDIQPSGSFAEDLNRISEADEIVESSNVSIESKGEQIAFSTILSDFLPAGTDEEINEEQLFSAIIAQRLESLKGKDAVTAYQDAFEKHLSAMKYPSGYEPVEDAARAALNDLSEDGVLSLEEAESVHAQSFQAAQLDNNHDVLYDSLGSTTAVTMVEIALQSSSEALAGFDSGDKNAGRMSLKYMQDSGSSIAGVSSVEGGQTVNAAIGSGFLFKPVSEGDGNLVVLLPSSMSGQVAGVTIKDSSGQVLDQGTGLGDYDDGRPLFRFHSPGGGYPSNITVSALMSDGEEYNYSIPAPSQRYE